MAEKSGLSGDITSFNRAREIAIRRRFSRLYLSVYPHLLSSISVFYFKLVLSSYLLALSVVHLSNEFMLMQIRRGPANN